MYESGATRWFKFGRTDTIRSTTNASTAFVRAMAEPNISVRWEGEDLLFISLFFLTLIIFSLNYRSGVLPSSSSALLQAEEKANLLVKAINAHSKYTEDVSALYIHDCTSLSLHSIPHSLPLIHHHHHLLPTFLCLLLPLFPYPSPQAISGQAVDRHLLGLKLTAAENTIETPEIFTDVAFSRSLHFCLSSSQVG